MNSDAAYTLLYQNRTMAELLLKSWLPSEVSNLLDYSTLRSESPKGYDEDGRQRTGDLLFSVKVNSGETVWVAVMIELQSSCDQMMAWRMLSYATLFWRRVESDRRLQEGLLPALVPVVLYNGRAPWTASHDLKGCVRASSDSPLWRYMANPSYFLIDVFREDPAHLTALGNPVGWTMLLQQAGDPGRARDIAAQIDDWCQARDRRDVVEAVRLILRELMVAGRTGSGDLELPPMTEREREMSLAENVDSWMPAWKQKVRDEARQEGRAEGLAEGRMEGEQNGIQLGLNKARRAAALMGLKIKFGDLGIRFWEDHFARQPFGRWEELLSAIESARSLDDLHRFRPQA